MDHKTERREFTRVRAQIEVQIASEGGFVISGHARDFSLNGLYLACKERLPAGTLCRASVFLGEATGRVTIKANGKIVRVDDDGMGIELTDIPVDSLEHLRKLVLYNSGDLSEQVEREFESHLGIKRRQ